MRTHHLAAIDLGASSGRVMLATFTRQDPDSAATLTLTEIHRFPNTLKHVDGHDTWDLDDLEKHILEGLNRLDSSGVPLDGIGIDTWGVDYVLLDEKGQRVGLAVAYRDSRTDGVMARMEKQAGRHTIYQKTGIQFMPFNTLYQLRALTEQQPEVVNTAAHLLMIPDYFHYRLTGALNWEYTNASTTQMLNIATGDWDEDLLKLAGVPRRWLQKPTQPGNSKGVWHSPRGRSVPVISVASHDTASAVVAAPLTGPHSAYLSSGTWSLMGIESPKAFNQTKALHDNITNEGGINDSYRVLRNIMGLWLFQRVSRELGIQDLPSLITLAKNIPPFTYLINPNEDRFINPPSMVNAIREACQQAGEPVPESPAELARCIFDSLAMLYRKIALQLADLQGAPLEDIHIVGGGSQNQFLNQLCADVCQVNVSAGPVEASTLGNIGCQLMALNAVKDTAEFRRIVASNFEQHHYIPRVHADFAIHWRRFEALCHVNEELAV
ncbi:rhamnulokinase [Rahnella rivi]|uniref:rhamnulokinase n=1 Tax=Rahnella rivi TaxID=2816249 RepID=UPI0039BE79A4